MKKLLAIALVMMLVVSLMTACKPGENNGKSSSNGGTAAGTAGNDGGGNDFSYGKNFLETNLKGDFSVTYKMTTPSTAESEGGTMIMVIIRTSKGYYFSASGDGGFGMGGYEVLYPKNGDVFDVHMNWGDGYGSSSGITMTREEIEEGFAFMSALSAMDSYAELFNTKFKKTGAETIVNRKCDVYSASVTNEGVTVTITYCFDQQTGIFMKSTLKSPEGSIVQECTEFKTSGVTLPSLSEGKIWESGGGDDYSWGMGDQAEWPAKHLPDGTPQYPDGNVWVNSADIFCVSIMVTNTSAESLVQYLKLLKDAGWEMNIVEDWENYVDPNKDGWVLNFSNYEDEVYLIFNNEDWFND